MSRSLPWFAQGYFKPREPPVPARSSGKDRPIPKEEPQMPERIGLKVILQVVTMLLLCSIVLSSCGQFVLTARNEVRTQRLMDHLERRQP